MQDFGIDKSWIDAGLDIDLIRNIMSNTLMGWHFRVCLKILLLL